MTTGGEFYAETSWTWRDRLRWKLFPSRFCELPDFTKVIGAVEGDCVHVKTCVQVSWLDLLRLIVTRKMVIKTETATENRVGKMLTTSTAYVVTRFER